MSIPNAVEPQPTSAAWAPPLATVEKPASARAVATETAATLLFDSRVDAETAIDKAASQLKPSEGQRKLSEIARKVAKREIRRAIVELLDIKVGNVVLKAWQRHGALLAAAQRTTTSGGREVVLLADHTVTSSHSPHIELAINGVEIGRITSKIAMTLQLVGVNAVVQRGELVGLQTGSIVASAKLSVEDVPVASRSRTVDAVAVIQLTTPIQLARIPGEGERRP